MYFFSENRTFSPFLAQLLCSRRFPITDYINTHAILYFYRLQTDPINPLSKEAFSICKSVDSDGIYTWYSFIGNICKELDLEITDFENFTRTFTSLNCDQSL
jgi:hypothetical protein